jgi:cell wall-associated NlpC family hydrolase
LDDDDYVQVAKKDVKPGDIALFRKGGQIDHSGIVVEMVQIKGPRILSKWASLHEVVHFPWEGPYNECEVTYHRVTQ